MSRRIAAVPLPRNVFRVCRPSGLEHFYWQERRGRPDHGPLVRLPEPRNPEFWRQVAALSEGALAAELTPGSFSALIEHYRTAAPSYRRLADSSKETYGYALDAIKAAWGALPVDDLRPVHIYALLDEYAERPSMGNLIVRVLSALLIVGIRAGYCQINHAREIEPLEEEGIGSEPWAEATYAHVLATAPPILLRAAVLARATGQRAVDLVKMRPVDREDNGLNLTIQKLRGAKHFVPIQTEALAVIDGWAVLPMVQYLTINGRRLSEGYLRDLWRAWRAKQAAVPDDATLHDLRAMAVCDRRLQGVAHQQIADQLRMSIEMVMRYSRGIDQRANAQAGMAVFEQAGNDRLKRVYAGAETRGEKALQIKGE